MIKVENVEVFNFEGAIRGLRNPMNSWDRSDSWFNGIDRDIIAVGDNDLELMRKLYKAGHPHRKYLRQIFVSMDITAPLYWWAEFDTYKVSVTRNSCSFMHKGVSKPFDITDFSTHDYDKDKWVDIIKNLNNLRDIYLDTKDPQVFQQIRCLLPSGYNQRSTITMNYENVVNMIQYREDHRLDEWRDFCKVLWKLPYLKEICDKED